MKWKLELGAWHKSQDDKNKQTNNSNFWNNVVALLFTKLYYYFQNNQLMMDDKLLFSITISEGLIYYEVDDLSNFMRLLKMCLFLI